MMLSAMATRSVLHSVRMEVSTTRSHAALNSGWSKCSIPLPSRWCTPLHNKYAQRHASTALHSGGDTMMAAVLNGEGELTTEKLRMPVPQAGEVLLKVNTCGVCHTDLHVIKNEVPFPKPAVLGHEVSGVVVAHGAGSTVAQRDRLPVGARAVGAFIMPCLDIDCFFCQRGEEEMCEKFFQFNRGKGQLYDGTTRLYSHNAGDPVAMYSMGGLAEYCVTPASGATLLPDNVPFDESAILGCALFTAFGALRNSADLREGETLAVVGCGGIGAAAIQVARGMGAAAVIAVDVCDEKLSKMVQLGATHTVNAKREDTVEAIRAATAGRGVDVALEALGSPLTFQTAVMAVRDGGRAVMVGIAPVGVDASVPITHIVRRQVTIRGSYGARASTDLPALIRLVSEGHLDIRAPVSRSFSLQEADLAYKTLDRGGIIGRAIVKVDGSF